MDLQKSEEKTTELVPYERGISLRKVVKGTLARFLPGAAIAMGGLAVFWPPMGPDGSLPFPLQIELMFMEMGPLVLGFGLGLLALHRWLYPDSDVTGRRGIIAGFAATMVLPFIGGLLLRGFGLGIVPTSFLVGLAFAVGVFFPWLTPTPEEKRSDRYKPDSPDQLPGSAPDAVQS